MADWWHENVVEPGKLPLLLALFFFIGTFAVVRGVTRMIRAGRGPFRNVSPGGLHVHHMVPGVLLMVVGGFGAVAADHGGWVPSVVAAVFGIGSGLVLDEFALILHMQDVYWSEQGRKSVELVVLTAALVAMLTAGFLPLGVDALSAEEQQNRLALASTLLGHFGFAVVSLAKGKPRLALFGVFVPLVALVGAVRLARPDSPWATRFYKRRQRARDRAVRRAGKHDARWSRLRRRLGDTLGGHPGPG